MEAVNPNLDGAKPRAPDAEERRVRVRVAAAIEAAGGVKQVAEKTGIARGTLEKYAARTSSASFQNAIKIAAAAELSLDELVRDESSKFGGGIGKLQLRGMMRSRIFGREHVAEDEFIYLPHYTDVHASAGHGLAVASERNDSVIAFARSFLRDHGATPEKCSVIRAKGDSMSPTIPDASLLIVDHSQSEVTNGCIMVINVGDDLLVKRVRRRLDGLVDLVSDNPAYPPETIGRDTIQQLRVVGRVVYFCRVP